MLYLSHFSCFQLQAWKNLWQDVDLLSCNYLSLDYSYAILHNSQPLEKVWIFPIALQLWRKTGRTKYINWRPLYLFFLVFKIFLYFCSGLRKKIINSGNFWYLLYLSRQLPLLFFLHSWPSRTFSSLNAAKVLVMRKRTQEASEFICPGKIKYSFELFKGFSL